MPVPTSQISWQGSLYWLLGVAVMSFLVSWIAANRMQIGRSAYVALLTVATAAASVGYVAWAGFGVRDVLTSRWAWGLLAAPICGAFLIIGMTKLPVVHQRQGRQLSAALLWEAMVYGLAEGVLLSALPVLIGWQIIHSLGWSGVGGGIARWTLPLVASLVVILVHHLGYWEYRNRLLVPISVGCGLLSAGYLVTGSPLAPTVAHVLSHASSVLHGAELPPHPHPVPPVDAVAATDLVEASS